MQREKLFVVTALPGPVMPILLLLTDQSHSLALLIDQSLLQAWLHALSFCNYDVTFELHNFFLYVSSCLLYKYLSLEGFPAVPGVDAVCRLDNRLPRMCPTEQLTPSHPRMATCSGSDVSATSVWTLQHSPPCPLCLGLSLHLGRASYSCSCVLVCPVQGTQTQSRTGKGL